MKKIRALFSEELPFIAAIPAVMSQLIFLVIPLVLIFLLSLFPSFSLLNIGWKVLSNFSLSNYLSSFSWSYVGTVKNSLILSYLNALICLLFCLPIGMVLVFRIPARWRQTVLFIFMLPSWTNFIVRIYSWFFLLGKKSFVTTFLFKIGLISSDSGFLATYLASLLGMVYCYFPFMLIPIFSALSNIEKDVLEASYDLGASRFQTFYRVILPLSSPGLYLGFILVTLSSFGEFAIPELLGGGKTLYWGSVVASKFLFICDYSMGAALTFVGVGFLLTSLLFVYIFLRLLVFLMHRFLGVRPFIV